MNFDLLDLELDLYHRQPQKSKFCWSSLYQRVRKIADLATESIWLVRNKSHRFFFLIENDFSFDVVKAEPIFLSFSKIECSSIFCVLNDSFVGHSLDHYFEEIKRLSEQVVRYYIARLILAVEAIEKLDNLVEDLNGTNIFINATQIKLLPQKYVESAKDLKSLQYTAPELLFEDCKKTKANQTIQSLWSVGVILFRFLVGWLPFEATSSQQTLERIKNMDVKWPKESRGEDWLSGHAYELINQLLDPDPETRLGSRGVDEIKNHRFFKITDFNWNKTI